MSWTSPCVVLGVSLVGLIRAGSILLHLGGRPIYGGMFDFAVAVTSVYNVRRVATLPIVELLRAVVFPLRETWRGGLLFRVRFSVSSLGDLDQL